MRCEENVNSIIDLGRLGHSNNETCNKPELVTLPDDTKALSCFCGTDCSVVLTHQNKVLACGGNRYVAANLFLFNHTYIYDLFSRSHF